MFVVIFLTLFDGSNVTLKVPDTKIDLNTPYGQLKVAIKDINTINMGIHVEDAVPYVQAVSGLGDSIHKIRDASMTFLQNNPRGGWKYLSTIQDHPDLEVKKRIKQLVEGYKETPRLFDIIIIGSDTISGEIQQKEIEGVSPSLGPLKIKISEIKTIIVKQQVKTVSLNHEEWTEASYILNSRVRITASGFIDLWPQTPGLHLAGPKGSSTAGKESTYTAGSLMGRGGDGKAFLIGENFSSNSFPTGKLELRIIPSIWNTPFLGSYEVRIE